MKSMSAVIFLSSSWLRSAPGRWIQVASFSAQGFPAPDTMLLTLQLYCRAQGCATALSFGCRWWSIQLMPLVIARLQPPFYIFKAILRYTSFALSSLPWASDSSKTFLMDCFRNITECFKFQIWYSTYCIMINLFSERKEKTAKHQGCPYLCNKFHFFNC